VASAALSLVRVGLLASEGVVLARTSRAFGTDKGLLTSLVLDDASVGLWIDVDAVWMEDTAAAHDCFTSNVEEKAGQVHWHLTGTANLKFEEIINITTTSSSILAEARC
jgi:hypothetical protein